MYLTKIDISSVRHNLFVYQQINQYNKLSSYLKRNDFFPEKSIKHLSTCHTNKKSIKKFEKYATISSLKVFSLHEDNIMKKECIPKRIYRFYLEGFKQMKLGRTLWLIILVKLFIMFFILKLFFFPRVLNRFDGKQAKEEHVSSELIQRAIP